jgi:hypothetical protein
VLAGSKNGSAEVLPGAQVAMSGLARFIRQIFPSVSLK